MGGGSGELHQRSEGLTPGELHQRGMSNTTTGVWAWHHWTRTSTGIWVWDHCQSQTHTPVEGLSRRATPQEYGLDTTGVIPQESYGRLYIALLCGTRNKDHQTYTSLNRCLTGLALTRGWSPKQTAEANTTVHLKTQGIKPPLIRVKQLTHGCPETSGAL